MIRALSTAAILLGALAPTSSDSARAQDRARTVADGVYTDAKAARGAAA